MDTEFEERYSPAKIKQVLIKVFNLLEKANIPAASIGAIALDIWEFSRATYDIDILIGIENSNLDFLRKELNEICLYYSSAKRIQGIKDSSESNHDLCLSLLIKFVYFFHIYPKFRCWDIECCDILPHRNLDKYAIFCILLLRSVNTRRSNSLESLESLIP